MEAPCKGHSQMLCSITRDAPGTLSPEAVLPAHAQGKGAAPRLAELALGRGPFCMQGFPSPPSRGLSPGHFV